MLYFIEYPKCSTCKKAKAELRTLGVEFEAIDLVTNTPKKEQLLQWMEQSDFEIKSYFNTSGIKYRELGLKDQVATYSMEEAAQVLSTDGMLMKRPLLVKDGKVLQLGYRTNYAQLGL